MEESTEAAVVPLQSCSIDDCNPGERLLHGERLSVAAKENRGPVVAFVLVFFIVTPETLLSLAVDDAEDADDKTRIIFALDDRNSGVSKSFFCDLEDLCGNSVLVKVVAIDLIDNGVSALFKAGMVPFDGIDANKVVEEQLAVSARNTSLADDIRRGRSERFLSCCGSRCCGD
jgi:hypothetical protein